MIEWVMKQLGALWDWWQEEVATSERRNLARLEREDEEERVLNPLRIESLNAEVKRVEVEIGALPIIAKRKEAK